LTEIIYILFTIICTVGGNSSPENPRYGRLWRSFNGLSDTDLNASGFNTGFSNFADNITTIIVAVIEIAY
jgi:hypothetical protein